MKKTSLLTILTFSISISCCIEINPGNWICRCNPDDSISLTYNKSLSPKDKTRTLRTSYNENIRRNRQDKSANSNLDSTKKQDKLAKKILKTRKKEFKERIREHRKRLDELGHEIYVLSDTPASLQVSSGNLSDSSLSFKTSFGDVTQNMSSFKKSNSLNIENKYVKLNSLNTNDTKTNKNN